MKGGNGHFIRGIKMSDWNENHKGNYVYFDDGIVTTVFKNFEEEWIGVREGLMTEKSFKTANDVMEAIDFDRVNFSIKMMPSDSGWRKAKKGGFYRQCSGGIATVKQAKSGKWYVTIDGNILEGQWLKTKEEAVKLADLLLW